MYTAPNSAVRLYDITTDDAIGWAVDLIRSLSSFSKTRDNSPVKSLDLTAFLHSHFSCPFSFRFS